MAKDEEMTTIKVSKSTADIINSIRSMKQLQGEQTTNEEIVLEAVKQAFKSDLARINAFLGQDDSDDAR